MKPIPKIYNTEKGNRLKEDISGIATEFSAGEEELHEIIRDIIRFAILNFANWNHIMLGSSDEDPIYEYLGVNIQGKDTRK